MSESVAMMPVPLYHGTSSWFLPGILERGLGAVDVHAGLRSREFYSDVWNLRLTLADAEECEKLVRHYGIRSESIIANAVTPGGQNYRYDAVYCTGSEHKAVTYAARGFGSELIRLGAGWLEEIRCIVPDAAAALLADYPDMAACLAHEHSPVVIRLVNIERRFVKLENGNPFTSELDAVAEVLSFELIEGADLSTLTILRADSVEMGFVGAESYDLVPLVGGSQEAKL